MMNNIKKMEFNLKGRKSEKEESFLDSWQFGVLCFYGCFALYVIGYLFLN
jgi:hypothetical protein